MNVLVIADRFSDTCSIFEIVKKDNIELIITLGDLDSYSLAELNEIKIPKIGVYGNHCDGNYFQSLGIRNVHLNPITINQYTFNGFQGAYKYKEKGNFLYTQEDCKTLMSNMKKCDIFISHSPPYGINDSKTSNIHIGFDGIREYINNQKPKLIFHGHTYPKDSHYSKLHETGIIYVYGWKVFNLEKLISESSSYIEGKSYF